MQGKPGKGPALSGSVGRYGETIVKGTSLTRLAPQRDAVGHPGALEVVPQLPFLELAHVELVELLVRELGEGGDLREIVRGRRRRIGTRIDARP